MGKKSEDKSILGAPSASGALRMLRCTFCQAVISSKTAIAIEEARAFWNEHEMTPGHPGTIEATQRRADGSRFVGPLPALY